MGFPNVSMTGSALDGTLVQRDVEFFEDFLSGSYENGGLIATTADLGDWLSTETNQGAVKIGEDEEGGVLHITTDTADNDGYEFQLNGESFKVVKNKDIYFECRLKLTAAVAPLTTIDWCIGLSSTDTAVMDGTTEFVGFSSSTGSAMLDAGGASIHSVHGNAMASSWSATFFDDTGIDYVDDTYFKLAFHVISNTRIEFYVNGTRTLATTTNIPTANALTPTICVQNNAAAAKQMLVDYIYIAQKR